LLTLSLASYLGSVGNMTVGRNEPSLIARD
jgi:hypothetical protein